MTTELTDTQRAALEVIAACKIGDEITGAKLANAIGLRPRSTGKEGADMRAVINGIRVKGYPVCANGKGYYYPQNRIEIETYIVSLKRRVDSMTEAYDGMRGALSAWDERLDVRELPTQQTLIEI